MCNKNPEESMRKLFQGMVFLRANDVIFKSNYIKIREPYSCKEMYEETNNQTQQTTQQNYIFLFELERKEISFFFTVAYFCFKNIKSWEIEAMFVIKNWETIQFKM